MFMYKYTTGLLGFSRTSISVRRMSSAIDQFQCSASLFFGWRKEPAQKSKANTKEDGWRNRTNLRPQQKSPAPSGRPMRADHSITFASDYKANPSAQ